jgi:type IV pilus assembly protein PilW
MNLFPMRRARGFSLVELMVSVVVGMLALMFATRLITGAEQNKQAALGGSDAMQNGMLAMFSISNDAAQAGFGLNDPILVGCDTVMVDNNGYTLAQVPRGAANVRPLAAAVIESNGANPDRISLYSGSSQAGTATLRVMNAFSAGGATLEVDRVPYGFSRNDVLLLAPETAGGQCALTQITTEPVAAALLATQTVSVAPVAGARFASIGAGAGPSFVASMTRAFNLGQANTLSFHTWSVANGFLQLRATDLAGASANPSTVTDNVVSIKAQYGFDKGAPPSDGQFNPDNGMVVSEWSPTMINADGIGGVGDAEDYQRITALRIAVVARSRSPERPAPGAACTATTTRPVVFASASPAGVAPAPVSVNVAVAGDPVDWKCYRYRVFETIVPMRNSAWRPFANRKP